MWSDHLSDHSRSNRSHRRWVSLCAPSSNNLQHVITMLRWWCDLDHPSWGPSDQSVCLLVCWVSCRFWWSLLPNWWRYLQERDPPPSKPPTLQFRRRKLSWCMSTLIVTHEDESVSSSRLTVWFGGVDAALYGLGCHPTDRTDCRYGHRDSLEICVFLGTR